MNEEYVIFNGEKYYTDEDLWQAIKGDKYKNG